MIRTPTLAPAGSAEKIEVMRKRVAEGLPTDHPLDTQVMVEQRPDPEPPESLVF